MAIKPNRVNAISCSFPVVDMFPLVARTDEESKCPLLQRRWDPIQHAFFRWRTKKLRLNDVLGRFFGDMCKICRLCGECKKTLGRNHLLQQAAMRFASSLNST